MNIRNLFFNFASITFCAMMLIGCDSDDVLSDIPTETDPNEMHTCKLDLNVTKAEYDAKVSRSTSTTWNEGDKIYLTFTTDSASTTGTATYTDSTWIINYTGSLIKNTETQCTAVYFENPLYSTDNFVKTSEKTAIYEDVNGKYIFNDSILSVTANMKPKTGRIRFKGNKNDAIRVLGLSYYTTYDVSTRKYTKTSVLTTATVDSTEYSGYIYAELADTVSPRINLITKTSGFTRMLSNLVLKKGESGYMDIPTKESPKGWTNSLLLKVKGVEFTMIPVEKVTTTTTTEGSTETRSTYFLAETETTQELYCAVLGGTTSYPQRPQLCNFDAYDYDYNTTETWEMFTIALRESTGLPFRMPYYDEWKYAQKGGEKSQGYTYSGSNNIDEVAWYSGNTTSTKDVKQLQPNELGFYDMSGNAIEITYQYSSSDKYHYYSMGGSYNSTANYCTLSNPYYARYMYTDTYSYSNIGFRVAFSY